MDLPGSAYLYTLAVVSITFVGFSALIIVFRQSVGGKPTPYETYFTLSFVKIGFIVSAGSLVPPLLALYGWSPDATWRVGSIVLALPVLWFVATIPAHRRAATGRPIPAYVRTLLTIQALSAVALVLESLQVFQPGPGVYASALTIVLITSGMAYLVALSIAFPEARAKQ